MEETTSKPAWMELAEIKLGASFEQIAREKTREGWSDERIAALFGVHPNTYANWRERLGLVPMRDLVYR